MQVSLPDNLMSTLEILNFIKVADCYPNVSIAYRILLIIRINQKKLLQIEAIEKLFEVNCATRKIKWLGYVQH
jgi:hypothetical protein